VVGGELDLRGWIGAHGRVVEWVLMYAYLVAPGYSIVVPSGDDGRIDHPGGP